MNLTEINPSVSRPDYKETIFYSKVKTELLSQEVLYKYAKIRHGKEVNVVDMGSHYVYQYTGKPSIFIDKTNGKLYALEDNHFTRLQAIFLLQILSKFSLVEGYKRKQSHRKYIQWIEE